MKQSRILHAFTGGGDGGNLLSGWLVKQAPGAGEGWFTLHPTPGDRNQPIKQQERLLLVEGSVPLDEFLLLFRHIFQSMNRVRGTGWNAGATVDTAIGIYVHLGRSLEGRLVLFGMDTIRGADVNTQRIFDAGISDYIGHDESVSWNEQFRFAHSGV